MDISGKELKKVIENDLELFVNLHTVRAGDNSLELESLGNIPFLKSLYLPLNGVSNIQFTAALKFPALEVKAGKGL